MGPLDGWGNNAGAKGAVVKFVPGVSDLDPSFPLHPELIKVYNTPDTPLPEIVKEMTGYKKLETGVVYEGAR
jgi:hypothetical protein